jgi:hypothetical protein
VYGLDSTFINNGFLYLDSALLVPAPTGWYLVTGSLPVFVGANGQITQIGNCDSCQCLTYYPHLVCVDISPCAACCCYNPTQTVFSTSTVFINSTQLFLDNSGTTPAPEASYKKGNDVANVVGTNGDITSYSSCVACAPCDEGDIEVYVEIFVEKGGYNSGALLQKSFDNINWVDVGELEITPINGSNVTVANSYFLNPLIYTRVVFTSNVDGGTMTSEHLVNTTSIEEVSNSTPGSRTLTSDILVDGNIYKFLCRIEGGFAPPSDRVYVGGNYNLYQDAATFPCGNPSCGPIEAILALDQTAEIVEQFNTETNFSFPGISIFGPNVLDLQKVGDYIAVGYNGLRAFGILPDNQSTYKGVPVTNGIVLLNTDGSLNTSFNTTRGAYTSYVYV